MRSSVSSTLDAENVLREYVDWSNKYRSIGEELGVTRPTGLLLRAPLGCSFKESLGRICEKNATQIVEINASLIIDELSKGLELALQQAYEVVKNNGFVVILINEIHYICKKSAAFHDKLMCSQVIKFLDELLFQKESSILVIASTTLSASIDEALYKPGRLQHELVIGLPDTNQRENFINKILKCYPEKIIKLLAEYSVGFSEMDLVTLCKNVLLHQEANGKQLDFLKSFKGFHTYSGLHSSRQGVIKNDLSALYVIKLALCAVGWNDIGGLHSVKKQIFQIVVWPLKYSTSFKRLNLTPVKGLLLYGPSGCCKTTLVKAAACESNASFQTLLFSQIYDSLLGQGEEAVRQCFLKAKTNSPSIIFLDELDALFSSRGSITSCENNGNTVGSRLLATLLTEIDGIENTDDLIIIAATNRIDDIDPALLRSGRFDIHLHVPPPNLNDRLLILESLCLTIPVINLNFKAVAEMSDGFTGADLKFLCQEAAFRAMEEGAEAVTNSHFKYAITKFNRKGCESLFHNPRHWVN